MNVRETTFKICYLKSYKKQKICNREKKNDKLTFTKYDTTFI